MVAGRLDDQSLPEVGSVNDELSALEALAQIQAQVMAFNAKAVEAGISSGFLEAFKRWLKRCYEVLKAIVANISNAISFSVSAATPWTLSVSVTFATSETS